MLHEWVRNVVDLLTMIKKIVDPSNFKTIFNNYSSDAVLRSHVVFKWSAFAF
jgi:hypothetical protein